MPEPITPQKPTEAPELNYQQDIHNKDLRDIVAEGNEWEGGEWEEGQEPKKPVEKPIEAKQDEKPIEPQKPEELIKPKETPIEIKPQEPLKPLDEEKLTDNITQKLLDKLSPETPEEKKDFQKKLKELNETAAKENRQPTYEEALALLGGELEEKLPAKLKEEIKKELLDELSKEVETEEKTKKEAEETQKKQTEQTQQQLYGEWDRQLGILQQQGKIPAVVNKDDPEDAGMKAQKVLFEAMNAYAKEQETKGQKVSLNLIETFMSPHYEKLTKQPGKDAPVNGARKSVMPDSKPGLTYKEIHTGSLEDFIREAYEVQNAS